MYNFRFYLAYLIIAVLSIGIVRGQQVCQEDERPGSTCDQTCLLCDIDGLSKYIEIDNNLEYGKQGCNTGFGDAYAFIAMSTSLTVEVTVGKCESIEGKSPIPAAFVIYEDLGTCNDSIFGETLLPLTECSGGSRIGDPQTIVPNSSKVFTTNRALTIGQKYFFEVGIVDSTECFYSIKVLEGSTKVPQLTAFTLDNIYDPCQGETVDYAVLNPEPITNYVYTLDGDTISEEAFAQVTYDRPGTYELCITGSNPCSQATATCYTISVNPPTETTTEDYLCPGECYTTPDSVLCDPGTYQLTLTDQHGCDSLLTLTLLDRAPDITDLQATICNGDTLRYLEQSYFEAGTYPSALTNRFGCDSTINLEILLAACPLAGSITSTAVACHDGSDGSLSFSLSSGSPPYRYDFRRLGGGPAGSGTIARQNELTTFTDLPAGTYLIEVTDDFGSVGFFNAEVSRPPAIEVVIQKEQYNGSDLSCSDSADAVITATASGGTGAFTYTWSDSEISGSKITNLAAGTYSVTATDERGCTHTESVVLVSPPPLRLLANTTNEECGTPSTGKLLPPVATGGTGSIDFILSRDNQTVPASQYNVLPAATYVLTARDQNGCQQDTTLIINSPIRPEASISPTNPYIVLGDELTLSVDD